MVLAEWEVETGGTTVADGFEEFELEAGEVVEAVVEDFLKAAEESARLGLLSASNTLLTARVALGRTLGLAEEFPCPIAAPPNARRCACSSS